MAKGEQQQTRSDISRQRTATSGQTSQIINNADAQRGGFQGQSAGLRDFLIPSLGDMASSPTGGYSDAPGLQARAQANSNTGGYGDTTDLMGRIQKSGNLDVPGIGGFDEGQLAKLRSGYGALADTGGFSPEESATYLRHATSGVPAIYNVLEQEAQRRRSATGGLGPGGDMAQMARQMAQQQAVAQTGAQNDLASQIRAGKLAGLGGLGGVESNVAGNQLQAANLKSSNLARSLGMETGLTSDIAAGKRQAFGTEAGVEAGIAGNKLAEKQGGVSGLLNLVNSNNEQDRALAQQQLSAMGIDAGMQQQLLQLQSQLANSPGLFDNILKIISVAGGAAAGGAGVYKAIG